MEQAKIYMFITNDRGEKCLFLTPQAPYINKPENPEIIYDGGENAILYRNKNENIIIDYIPEKEKENLVNAKEILTVEYDIQTKKIINEYMAKIIKTKIPAMPENFIKA